MAAARSSSSASPTSSPGSTVTPFPLTRLARFELRRFRGVVPAIALVFVMCVPLLYAAIYLTANWDPYGKLDRLPVAVVNTDSGTTVDGQPLTAGVDFVTSLIDQHTFDYREVSAAEADRGLREGDYFLTVTVPADFSAHLVSGMGDDPERAGIALRRNDANGFVIGTITGKAQSAVTEAVNASAEEAYFTAVFANLSTIRSGLVDARDGSAKLAEGLDDASSGANDLATGATSAKTGATTLSTAAGRLSTGLGTAKTGAASLATGLGTLDTESGKLATGAQQMAAGTQELEDTVVPPLDAAQKVLPQIEKSAGSVSSALDDIADAATGSTDSVASGLAQTSASLAAVEKAHPELADDPDWVAARRQATSAAHKADGIATTVDTAAKDAASIKKKVAADGGISGKLATAKKNVTDLNDGAQAVATGASQLHTGIGTAKTGATNLSSGVSDAATGATQLSTGADQLATGLGTLSTGARTLRDGLSTLDRGAHTLNDGLADAAQRIPVLPQDKTDQAVQVLSEPADVSMTVDNPAGVYGRGLAPMFFSIALWVFGISAFLVVRPISGRALAGRASAARLAIGSWPADRRARSGRIDADARDRLDRTGSRPGAPGADHRGHRPRRRSVLRDRPPAAQRPWAPPGRRCCWCC